MDIFKNSIEGDLASISTPFNPEFSDKMRMLGGKFNNDDKTWTVDSRNIEIVRETMRKIYGRDDYPTDLTSVKITFNANHYSTGLTYMTQFGRLLASVTEDKTLRNGSDVAFCKGQPCRYTQSNNTVGVKVLAGTIAIMHDIPRNIIERDRKKCDRLKITIEYIEHSTGLDSEKLMEEKNRLLARVEEINSLIQKNSAD